MVGRATSAALLTALFAAGCAAAPRAPGQAAVSPAEPGAPIESLLVPPGYGTLKQDEFTMDLRDGALLVKVTPLSEAVIRLAAPDTYGRLHALAERWRAEALQSGLVDRGELFQVSFFSYEPDVTFQPEDLLLLHQGRLLRPLAILPITPGWGTQRLTQRDVQSAVYVFRAPFDFEQSLALRYGLIEEDDWRRIVPLLQTERARVRARAGAR